MATSGVVLWNRHQIERGNRTIAFLMDGPDVLRHSNSLDVDVATYLQALQEAGLYGLVIPYGYGELREIARATNLAVVAAFHNEDLDTVLAGIKGEEVAGITFLSADSNVDPAILELLPDITQYIIQRNDTFRGYIPSDVNLRIVAEELPAVRTYLISRAETDNPEVTPDNMVMRWLSNIREYNTRAIYARPFLDGGADKNVLYVGQVANSLEEAGYHVGPAKPFASLYFHQGTYFLLSLGAGGVVIGLIYLLSMPVFFKRVGLAGIFLAATLVFTPYSLYLRLGMALAAAVAAGSLGAVWALREKNSSPWWHTAVLVNILTLTGVLVTASLQKLWCLINSTVNGFYERICI